MEELNKKLSTGIIESVYNLKDYIVHTHAKDESYIIELVFN